MTNEPMINEVVNITECHEFAEVTTRSDVGAGLENGGIGDGEERESLAVCEASTKALVCPDMLRPDRRTEDGGEAAKAGGFYCGRNPRCCAGLSEAEFRRTTDTALGRDQYGWSGSQAPATTATQVTSLRPAVDGG